MEGVNQAQLLNIHTILSRTNVQLKDVCAWPLTAISPNKQNKYCIRSGNLVGIDAQPRLSSNVKSLQIQT